jgi:hypothetical protein
MAETEHADSTKKSSPAPRAGRWASFARRHPGLTVIGAAAVSLVGGVEIAAGVLIGAGVLALVGSRRELDGATRGETPAPEREIVPPDLRARARAIVQAVRGELQPRQA